MSGRRSFRPRSRWLPRHHRDRGAVDVSIQMLFGSMAVIMVVLLIFEAVVFWHARNIFDEAASEGARVAAAYDGTCEEGIAVATDMVQRHAGSWASGVLVTCTEGDIVRVVVAGATPGVLGERLGMRAQAVETAPKELSLIHI